MIMWLLYAFAALFAIGLSVFAYLFYLFYQCDANVQLTFYEKFGQQSTSLAGKTVWITGASSGIGAELALELAVAGCRLILSGTKVNNLNTVKRRCLIGNGTLQDQDVLVLPMDMMHTDTHNKALDAVISHFGKLDILVNNAGRYQLGLFKDVPLEVDRENFEVNVFGLINLTRVVVNHWIANDERGQIAVTSSGYGKIAGPTNSTYVATKHALHGYFDSIRHELYHKNITISVVCPGPIVTNLMTQCYVNGVDERHSTADHRYIKYPSLFMSAERCAQLYAVALANQLAEAWIMNNPMLLGAYFAIYLPSITRFVTPFFLTEARLNEMLQFD